MEFVIPDYDTIIDYYLKEGVRDLKDSDYDNETVQFYENLNNNNQYLQLLLSNIVNDLNEINKEDHVDNNNDNNKGICNSLKALNILSFLISGIWIKNNQNTNENSILLYNIMTNAISRNVILNILNYINIQNMNEFKEKYDFLSLSLFLIANNQCSNLFEMFQYEIIQSITLIFCLEIYNLTIIPKSDNFEIDKIIEFSLLSLLHLNHQFCDSNNLYNEKLISCIFNLLIFLLSNSTIESNTNIISTCLKLLSDLPMMISYHILLPSCLQSIDIITKYIKQIKELKKIENIIEINIRTNTWKLWIKIIINILDYQNINENITNDISFEKIKNKTEAKQFFNNLVTPLNGCGIIIEPLQDILNKSRSYATQCYLLLTDLVTSTDKKWYSPTTTLKLLIKCIHYILFTPPLSNKSVGDSSIKKRKLNQQSSIEFESDHFDSIRIAGDTLVLICSRINWIDLLEIVHVSVSANSCKNNVNTPNKTNIDFKERISIYSLVVTLIGIQTINEIDEERRKIGVTCAIIIIKGSNPFFAFEINKDVDSSHIIDCRVLFEKGIFANKTVSYVYSDSFMGLLVSNKLIHPITSHIYSLQELSKLTDLILVSYRALKLINNITYLKELIKELTISWQLMIHLISFSLFIIIIKSNMTNNLSSSQFSTNSIIINRIYHSTQFESHSIFSPLSSTDVISHNISSNAEEQFVINSSNEEATNTTIYLFKTVSKIWKEFLLSDRYDSVTIVSRTLFIESFIWFLHRSSSFNLNIVDTDEDYIELCSIFRTKCNITIDDCPHSLAGVLMLIIISHVKSFEQSKMEELVHGDDLTVQSIALSWRIVLQSLKRSFNSLAQTGALSTIFKWIPCLLSKSSLISRVSAGNDSIENKEGEIILISRDIDCNLSDYLIFILLRESLLFLSYMSAPSLSEQNSPEGLLQTVHGLSHLIYSPIIMLASSSFGFSFLFNKLNNNNINNPSIVEDRDNEVFLTNWSSIFTLWLDLSSIQNNKNERDEEFTPGSPFDHPVNTLVSSMFSCVQTVNRSELIDRKAIIKFNLIDIRLSVDFHQVSFEIIYSHIAKYPDSETVKSLLFYFKNSFISTICSFQYLIIDIPEDNYVEFIISIVTMLSKVTKTYRNICEEMYRLYNNKISIKSELDFLINIYQPSNIVEDSNDKTLLHQESFITLNLEYYLELTLYLIGRSINMNDNLPVVEFNIIVERIIANLFESCYYLCNLIKNNNDFFERIKRQILSFIESIRNCLTPSCNQKLLSLIESAWKISIEKTYFIDDNCCNENKKSAETINNDINNDNSNNNNNDDDNNRNVEDNNRNSIDPIHNGNNNNTIENSLITNLSGPNSIVDKMKSLIDSFEVVQSNVKSIQEAISSNTYSDSDVQSVELLLQENWSKSHKMTGELFNTYLLLKKRNNS